MDDIEYQKKQLRKAVEKYASNRFDEGPHKHPAPYLEIACRVNILIDEVLGNTSYPDEIEHTGVHADRTTLKQHALEKIFAEEWSFRNDTCLDCPNKNGTLDYILAEDNTNIPSVKSQRDATVAASVIQWLGSTVGFAFIFDVIVQALQTEETKKDMRDNLVDILENTSL